MIKAFCERHKLSKVSNGHVIVKNVGRSETFMLYTAQRNETPEKSRSRSKIERSTTKAFIQINF